MNESIHNSLFYILYYASKNTKCVDKRERDQANFASRLAEQHDKDVTTHDDLDLLCKECHSLT